MDIFWWNGATYLYVATSIMVPFGILSHYWRRADAVLPISTSPVELDPPDHWPLATRRLIRRGRIVGGVTTVAAIMSIQGIWLPNRYSDTWYSFLLPTAIATVCIGAALLAPAVSHRAPRESLRQVDLSPRSIWSFGQRWWFASWIIVSAAITLTVVLAGLASSRDDRGRFAWLTVEVGYGGASTTFPGWYFGVPVLIALAVLAGVSFLALWAGARPPMALAGRAADVSFRSLRTRIVLSLGGGALVLTLSWLLMSMGDGATVRFGTQGGDLGPITVGSSLAAIATPLKVAGVILQGLGVALMLLPVFTKRPRRTAHIPASSGALMADSASAGTRE